MNETLQSQVVPIHLSPNLSTGIKGARKSAVDLPSRFNPCWSISRIKIFQRSSYSNGSAPQPAVFLCMLRIEDRKGVVAPDTFRNHMKHLTTFQSGTIGNSTEALDSNFAHVPLEGHKFLRSTRKG
jgi:hypothetical protein